MKIQEQIRDLSEAQKALPKLKKSIGEQKNKVREAVLMELQIGAVYRIATNTSARIDVFLIGDFNQTWMVYLTGSTWIKASSTHDLSHKLVCDQKLDYFEKLADSLTEYYEKIHPSFRLNT